MKFFKPTASQRKKREPRGKLSLYWGFPVEGRNDNHNHGNRFSRDVYKKRGIALIIAIMIISVMMMTTTDLILNSKVNLELALKQRDAVKAEFLAKSGFNIATMLVSADFAYDLFQLQQNPQGSMSDGLGDFWTALNGLPIGGDSAEMMTSFQEQFGLSEIVDHGVIDQLKMFEGSFVVEVEDEQSKINLNNCSLGRCSETLLMLEALFSCPAEAEFLERKQIKAREVVYRIKDWVDTNSQAEAESGYNNEDEPYAKRTPKLSAKNAPFDTLEELKLIEGWDDEMHIVFSKYLTIFPFQEQAGDRYKVNLNSAPRALLQCLVPESRGECEETSTLAIATRNRDKASLGAPGQSISDTLKNSFCYSVDKEQSGEASNKVNWFDQKSNVFRIKAQGITGTQVVNLASVIERKMPDPKVKGARSYQILYWKSE